MRASKYRFVAFGLVAAAALALGCHRGSSANGAGSAASIPAGAIRITVHEHGYEPSEVSVPAGRPVNMVFTRTSDEGCGQQLVFPDLNIRRDLPLNQPVLVSFNAPASGRVRFTCGMDMYRGAVVVQ